MKNILLAGESWTSTTTHVKGFDYFVSSVYEEGADPLIKALKNGGYQVDYMNNSNATLMFPFSAEELSKYACVILSDIGSNSLLLHPNTFSKSIRMPNRCEVIKEYVKNGGSLFMVGGYMSFSGIDAKAKYGHTAIDEILPVSCLLTDDLMEHPEGVYPQKLAEHDSIKSIYEPFPYLLGYNKTIKKENAENVLSVCGDPLLAFMNVGKGKTGAFTSDCSPHWAPPEFVEWEEYDKFFQGILDYLTSRG